MRPMTQGGWAFAPFFCNGFAGIGDERRGVEPPNDSGAELIIAVELCQMGGDAGGQAFSGAKLD